MLILAWCGVGRAGGEADLVLDSAIHDFGPVEQGVFVRHVFRFRNAGDGDLKIEDIRTPCGCTAALSSEKTVVPGAEGAIGVSLDTAPFTGQKTKTVAVSTNDPARPVSELTVRVNVIPKLIADPPVLYFGKIRPGAGASARVRILSTSGEAIKINHAATVNPALEVSAEPPSGRGEAGRVLVVRVPPEMLCGRFNDTLRITTAGPESTELDVPVFGSVEGDLLVWPNQVMFGSAVGGRSGTRELRVSNSGPRPISISGLRVPDFPLDYAVSTVDAGYEYRIVLRLKHPGFGLRWQNAVHIYTTHPEEPELIVPLYAMMDRRGEARH
jgi:hypothetical protein